MTPVVTSVTPPNRGITASRRRRMWAVPEVRWATLATGLFAVGGTAQLGSAPAPVWWALYLACYAAGGWEPGLAGLRAIRDKRLDVDLLMVAAALGAASIGQVFDGALLIVIFATSGALEAVATARTEDSVRSLLDLAPEQATRLRSDGGENAVLTAQLAVGEHILIRPGERIGADGCVVDGASDVDQASITGEPLPAAKGVGDEVFAGTLNGTGMLRVRVDRPAAESVVARIAALVKEAAKTKARTQLFIDKVEQRYSVGMVIATLAVFTIPLAFGADLSESLLRAMTFMIVASPCAVVLATMPPLLAAIANAGRHGVLVKSAMVMEQLADVSAVAFDKTGTLTEGTPRLAAVRPVPDGPCDADDLLTLAAAAEHPSEHPVARAIVAAARDAGIRLLPAANFSSAPGRGITADVAGYTVTVSSPSQILPIAGHDRSREVQALADDLERAGYTAVVVALDGVPVGALGVSDQPRPDATAAVAQLTALTATAPALLTGDNHRAAHHLADEVGILDVRAGLLPQDKVDAVRQLQATGQRVMLVGDGVNDAPALATAHTGVAMGRSGADLALHTADAIIVRDELATIPTLIALSRRARRIVAANLAIAATFIAILVTWDLIGHLPLPLGVAGHEGSTVMVGLNGLRLLRKTAWRQTRLSAPPDWTTVRPEQRRPLR